MAVFAAAEALEIGNEQDYIALGERHAHELFIRAHCVLQQVHRFQQRLHGQGKVLLIADPGLDDGQSYPAREWEFDYLLVH